MKRFSTFLATTLAIIGIATLAPAAAHAKGTSISVHAPGISIGFNDVYYGNKYRSSKRFNKRRYNRSNSYNNNYNYNNSNNYNRNYRYRNNSYNQGYSNNYNYYGNGYNNRSSNYCPNNGYSRNY